MKSDCYYDECDICAFKECNNRAMACLMNRLNLALYKSFREIFVLGELLDPHKSCHMFVRDSDEKKGEWV